MNDGPNGFDHTDRRIGLENVTSHIDADGAVTDRVVGQFESFEFRRLLAAGDDDRNRQLPISSSKLSQ